MGACPLSLGEGTGQEADSVLEPDTVGLGSFAELDKPGMHTVRSR